jgi:peptidase M48-like protein/PDZ domain-containing protein
MTRSAALLLFALLLAAAAPPVAAPSAVPSYPATTLRAEDLRVATLAYRIARQASRFCPEPGPVTGLLLHHLPEYLAADRPTALAAWPLDRGPGVLATVADSPAARAGLLAGDVLLDVNGHGFPDPRKMTAERSRRKWRAQVQAGEAMLESELRAGPARLRVLRNGQTLSLTLQPESGCPVRVRLARSTQLNAFADGRYVTLTTRLLGFVRNDDELAIVTGHELAHNILHHKERLEAEQVPKGLLGTLGKNASRVRATEEEADRLGLKLAWASGYDLSLAIPFWRRFYAAQGVDLQLFRTHPGLRAREALVVQTIGELAKQNPAGAP